MWPNLNRGLLLSAGSSAPGCFMLHHLAEHFARASKPPTAPELLASPRYG
jgi:hypothetical protein